ncbi:MAG: hypothetical protein IKZ66_01170 [Schwartzia sp.]|jgi:predicted DNA-binding protein|nr:hypothetical protein [Schwartzia sp. (in: firmicutes)]
MVTIKGVELTPEQVQRGMECDTPEELKAACKEIGIDVTVEEAEKFLENMEDIDLTSEQMKAVAGGDEASSGGVILAKMFANC